MIALHFDSDIRISEHLAPLSMDILYIRMSTNRIGEQIGLHPVSDSIRHNAIWPTLIRK